ncbi:MAG: hypothetical protein PHS92_05670 [Candidatus Gracilibacteria bacterium]|nr:hypothetical protein [Candidatus Gracilibacteria bacterium]
MNQIDRILGEQPNKELLDLILPNILEKYGMKVENLTKVILTPEARIYVDTVLQKKELEIDMQVKKAHFERIFRHMSGTQSADNYPQQEILSDAA